MQVCLHAVQRQTCCISDLPAQAQKISSVKSFMVYNYHNKQFNVMDIAELLLYIKTPTAADSKRIHCVKGRNSKYDLYGLRYSFLIQGSNYVRRILGKCNRLFCVLLSNCENVWYLVTGSAHHFKNCSLLSHLQLCTP